MMNIFMILDEKKGISTRYFILLIIFMVREIKRLELQK
ncbi:hypothetical protein KVMX100_60048 [Klebsiella variicola]|nr:hypothetical protein KVMX100_60048 [Klebsiella variicola]